MGEGERMQGVMRSGEAVGVRPSSESPSLCSYNLPVPMVSKRASARRLPLPQPSSGSQLTQDSRQGYAHRDGGSGVHGTMKLVDVTLGERFNV